jgi:glycosyltransferase involved in cell wall biosynthesis
MKIVSVILTTYNSEDTIQRTLNSILNQTGINKDFKVELIVVDDCSADRTCEILRNNKIEFYSTPVNSGGPNKGRNIGLRKVSGDYFCLIDHDDVWHPDKTLQQLKVAEEVPVVSTGYNVVNQQTNKKAERKLSAEGPVFFDVNESFLQKLKRQNKGQNLYLSTLMLSSRLKHIYFEENFGMVDYDWLLRITENNRTAEIPELLMTRFVTSENLSLDEHYRQKDYYYSLYFLENYKKKYPREYSISIKRLNGTRARYFYVMNDMKEARRFFLKSEINLKQIAYYASTFFGSRFIKRKFNVFG